MKTLLLAAILATLPAAAAHACAAVTRDGSLVVNADQTVIIIWDPGTRTQHFVRQADFRTDAPDIGFIVPTPSRPQLAEAGSEAFDTLAEITAPLVRTRPAVPFGCSAPAAAPARASSVRVIERKRLAGYDATVLTARSGDDLAAWLRENDYPHSPGIAAWAAPYLGGTWHFTAMKIAADRPDPGNRRDLSASAIRLTFRTDRPLFPYREPDAGAAHRELGATSRLLRIHFISDARYRGTLGGGAAWTGAPVWADDVTPYRERLLRELDLPATTGPARWILTEFEDRWPYAPVPGDLYFSRDPDQSSLDTRSTAPRPRRDLAMLGVLAFLGTRHITRRHRHVPSTTHPPRP